MSSTSSGSKPFAPSIACRPRHASSGTVLPRKNALLLSRHRRLDVRGCLLVVMMSLVLSRTHGSTTSSSSSSSWRESHHQTALASNATDSTARVEPPQLLDGLVWSDLSVSVEQSPKGRSSSSSSSSSSRTLLEPCSGFVPNGAVCGILGPSGAGKSTLLRALTGSLNRSSTWVRHRTTGHVHHCQTTTTTTTPGAITTRTTVVTPEHVAWLQQHDHFFELLTVQETVRFATFLELPHWTELDRETLVTTQLKSLGLMMSSSNEHPLHLQSPAQLSGGERRRLAVALELLTEKQVLLADEPTTGLDATLSYRVMQLIRSTAQRWHIPAVCVLHSPRSSLWHTLLSHVILVASGGKVCYAGPTGPFMDEYFQSLGYACPNATNPAEYYVDLISIDPEDAEQAQRDQRRIDTLAQSWQRHHRQQQQQQQQLLLQQSQLHLLARSPPLESTDTHRSTTQTTVPFPSNEADKQVPSPVAVSSPDQMRTTQYSTVRQRRTLVPCLQRLGALWQRSFRENIRSTTLNVARLIITVGIAYLMTVLYPTVTDGYTLHSIPDRSALLSMSSIVVCNMAFMKTAEMFEKEYPIVQRERMRNQYTALEYLLAKSLAEIPLDAIFAGVFAAVLKWGRQPGGLRAGFWPLTATFSLLTAAGASMGFFIGSLFSQKGMAVTAGLPMILVLMLVGIVTPSTTASNTANSPVLSSPPSVVTQWLKEASPFAHAIHAVLIQELGGAAFSTPWSTYSSSSWWPSALVEGDGIGGSLAWMFGASSQQQTSQLSIPTAEITVNGDQILEGMGLKDVSYLGAMKNLAFLCLVNLSLSWAGLSFHQNKYRLMPSRNSLREEEEEKEETAGNAS